MLLSKYYTVHLPTYLHASVNFPPATVYFQLSAAS